MIKVKCKLCDKEFEAERSSKKWCSLSCRNLFIQTNRNKRCLDCSCLIKNYNAKYCLSCCVKHKEKPYWGNKISKSKIGKKNSSNTKFKCGENHPNWKGGGTYTKRQSEMGKQEYKNWRVSVFVRDDYTCQHCMKKGGTLHADHIKKYSLYPELRLDIMNGRTLCVDCHRKTDTWGFNKKCKNINTVIK